MPTRMTSKFFASGNVSAQNQLVTWINDAGMAEGNKKADFLRKIIEVLIHQVPQMIPTYLDIIMSYSSDKSTEVKKQVIAFIEEISKTQRHYLPKVVGQLQALLTSDVIAVQKRVIQASSIVYRNTLQWICVGDADDEDFEYVWKQLTELKLLVLNMIDSDNEGIRTHSIKFLEEVVLLQTVPEGVAAPEDQFTLDKLPQSLPFVKRRALEEESEHIFTLLQKFHNSQHISSVNLMACMTTLCLICKFRPRYMGRVVQALADLHTTLPPTLSQSQVNSVRKHLKMLLLNLVRHQSSSDMLPQLIQLLMDIGMSSQEVLKAIPKERRNKRLGDIKNDAPTKRFRVDSPQSNSQGSDSNSRGEVSAMQENSNDSVKLPPAPVPAPVPPPAPQPVPPPVSLPVPQPVPPPTLAVPVSTVTEDSIFEHLNNIDTVVSLVMATLSSSLPDEMPSSFVTNYKPIPNAGSRAQKKGLAKSLVGIIKGEPFPTPQVMPPPAQPSLSDLAAKIPLLREDDEKTTLKNAVAKLQESTKAERSIETAVNKLMEETRQEHLKEEERKTKEKEKLVPPQTPTVPKLKQRVKLLKLQEITRPIPKEIKEKLMIQAVARILGAEKEASIGGATNIRSKLITIFASSYTPEIRDLVLSYILEDPLGRIELGIGWLYEEYAFMQGFNRHPVTLQPKVHEKHDQNYNQLLCALITQVCERGDPVIESAKDVLLRKIYLEAPLVTEEAVDYLKHLVSEEKIALLALELLEEICIMRPPRAHKYAAALLVHCLSENPEIRTAALEATARVHSSGGPLARRAVEKTAKLQLGFLAMDSPPIDMFLVERSRARHAWTDELRDLCLSLVVQLLPQNEELIIDVARVYGQSSADAKRCVLRCMEGPLRQLSAGQPRPAFMRLLEECPRGAETLLTRLVHILTEKAPPTPELVSLVRELYATRVSDVRFLIPVLNGLTEKEILAALPKLIKLNPIVVKEVFNRLLGLQNPNDEMLPVSPADLLIALHLIDPTKADLKYIIKATALCFAEKQVYTQEVLVRVLERLMEQPEIPVLMMRTVLQALTLYPNLAPRVLGILQRLMDKEVWTHKVAWEGWLKCCERTAPASCGILLCLPAAPLVAALSAAPALLHALDAHIAGLTPGQRSQLPPHVLAELSRKRASFAPPANAPPPAPAPPPPMGVPAPMEYQQVEAPYVPPVGANPANLLEPLPPGME